MAGRDKHRQKQPITTNQVLSFPSGSTSSTAGGGCPGRQARGPLEGT